MNKEEYQKLVKKYTPKEDKIKDYLNAFLAGGIMGSTFEIIKIILNKFFLISVDDSISIILLIVIFISCLLTGLGIFDNLVSKFKCGIIIPISGFAHSMMSSALDYKKDGFITGLGSNIFKLAGSVLLYGIVFGFLLGILKVIINV